MMLKEKVLDQRYDPSIFTTVNNLQAAKNIILTDEENLTTNERWVRETPHICDLIEKQIKIKHNTVVLDYGCGIGRIAKELIRRHGCYVIGVDIASNMQALAASYVNSDRFIICHPSALNLLGVKVDLVLAIWVLQHISHLPVDLISIKHVMKKGGNLFVVNEGSGRFVPTISGWINDGVDVRSELKSRFNSLSDGHLSEEVVGENQSKRTFWEVYSLNG